MIRNSWLPAAFLVTQVATASLAQQPTITPTSPSVPQQRPQKPEPEDVVRITTNLVQVDAVVTDKSGKPVTDLKPEEIEIFEDGRKQKITNFSYILAESLEAAVASKSAATYLRGEYVLQVTVNDLLADEKHRTASQWMDFEIVN